MYRISGQAVGGLAVGIFAIVFGVLYGGVWGWVNLGLGVGALFSGVVTAVLDIRDWPW